MSNVPVIGRPNQEGSDRFTYLWTKYKANGAVSDGSILAQPDISKILDVDVVLWSCVYLLSQNETGSLEVLPHRNRRHEFSRKRDLW